MTPQFMTHKEVMELLRIRHARTLANVRKAVPEIAIILPGTHKCRYVTRRIYELLERLQAANRRATPANVRKVL